MNNTKNLTTSAILIALAMVICMIIYYIPLLQIALFLIGVPIVVLGKVTDIRVQAIASLALIILMALIDPIFALLIGLTILPLSVIQGYLLGKNQRVSKVIAYGGVAMVFGMIVFVYGLNALLEIDIIAQFQAIIDLSVDQAKTVYSTIGTLTQDQLTTLYVMLEQMRTTMVQILPAGVMMYALLTSILSFVVSARILKSLKLPVKTRKFKDFRLDSHGRLIMMIVLGVITLMTFIDSANGDFYILNFMPIFNVVLQINALAFIWYLLEKHPSGKGLKIATVVLYITAPLIPGLHLIRSLLAIVGFVDMYMNFRLRIESRSE